VGIRPEELDEANDLLANPREVDLSVSQRLGLHVVARLAQRHGIAVSLTPTPGCGVTAAVVLPPELFSTEPAAEPAAGAPAEQPASRLAMTAVTRRAGRPATAEEVGPAPVAAAVATMPPWPAAEDVPGPDRASVGGPGPNRMNLGGPGPDRAGLGGPGPDPSALLGPGPDRSGPARPGPDRAGLGGPGAHRGGPGPAGPDRVGPARPGPERAGPGGPGVPPGVPGDPRGDGTEWSGWWASPAGNGGRGDDGGGDGGGGNGGRRPAPATATAQPPEPAEPHLTRRVPQAHLAPELRRQDATPAEPPAPPPDADQARAALSRYQASREAARQVVDRDTLDGNGRPAGEDWK
jgi:hypothetical protein